MNYKIFTKGLRTLVLMLAALVLAASPSYAVDLMAVEGSWTPPGPGATPITMWGFASDTGDCAIAPTLPFWTVGPQLTDTDLVTGNLTINLRNCLSEPVSIIIPGQPATFTPVTTVDGQGRTRITAFTTEAAANGGVETYTWTGVKAGTYLYQSGSHPAKQVQMGLYGALTIKGASYPNTSGDVTLLYSEIDPALHSPPTAATPLGYKPRHYLVNGSATQPTLTAGDTNQPTVLRFLNAGLDFHVPALNGGHMTLMAEDGNAYPFPKEQYSANLAAGKTIDALWQPASAGSHVIYDRRGNGMVASLTVGAGTDPVAVNDAYSTDEDTPLIIAAATGVLVNDVDTAATNGLMATLVSTTSAGTLVLATDGSFTYSPDPDANGNDLFTYLANDTVADSNVASVTITVNPVNDAPVAVDDAYNAEEGKTLSVAALGVLDNDTDVDGDMLNAVLATGPATGTLECPDPLGGPSVPGLCSDGSFDYTPTVAALGADSFTYYANDGTVDSAVPATVNISIIAPTNVAPVAVEDSATVQRNSQLVFINLTNNDNDADGNLKDDFGNVDSNEFVDSGFITLKTGTTTTRGGTVTVLTNGVNYTPKRNFRGTDTFNYTVTDLANAESNEVTVRVNVVK